MKRLEIPEAVYFRIRAAGARGERWLGSLQERIAHLSSKWRFTPGDVLAGGSESLVICVACESGENAVLKLGLPGVCDCANEARVLRIAGGAPYVRLLDEDADTNALLMERLGSALAHANISVEGQLIPLCRTLQKGWLPMRDPAGFMTGAEKALWLAEFIDATWREVEPGVSGAVKELAMMFANERAAAFCDSGSVLVHGDGHGSNALFALPPKAGLRLVDPDGLFAEPACDLAVPMRDWNGPLLDGDAHELGWQRCRNIARLTGVDETAIWQWGMMERVSTGLLQLQIGMEKAGRETLAVAEAWCRGDRR